MKRLPFGPSTSRVERPRGLVAGTYGVALAIALVGCALGDARAQPQATSAGVAPTAPIPETHSTKLELRDRFLDPGDGRLDLSDFLEHAGGFLPVPFLITEPAVGYGGGAAGMFLRPRREAGEEGWSRPNVSAAGLLGTQNGTRGAFAGDSSLWLGGRLKTLVGAATGRVNLDFYGLGGDRTSYDQAVRYSLTFTGVVLQANWKLAPKSPWAIGLRYAYADVEPTLRDEPAFPGLTDRVNIRISAPAAIVEFDTRDNLFTPTRGVYAESSYTASRKALGASADFERFQQVLLGWYPLTRTVTLGARGNYAWSSDGTPFFLRPFVMLRGVPAMRFQGEQAAFVEVEGRWQFHDRWSVVAFAGGGATRTGHDRLSISQSVGSGGVGFRYELARKFGLHAGVDVAHSPGTTAIYFQVGNAWLRP